MIVIVSVIIIIGIIILVYLLKDNSSISTLKWECSNNLCSLTKNGIYTTKDDCLSKCSYIPPTDSRSCFKGGNDLGVPINDQLQIASQFWKYEWDPIKQGTGVLQIVNSGTEPTWIRYGGSDISPGGKFDWKPYITGSSPLNGNIAHPWNKLNTNNMGGQGDGFLLKPGEYQIVPYVGIASWFAASLGCCKNGGNCIVNPFGRGGQPSTLFEWTSAEYGVWDASCVDGFQIPMKIEVKDTPSNIDAITYLQLDPNKCTNPTYDSNHNYVGCKSMCACQGPQPYSGKADPECPGMTLLKDMPPSTISGEARQMGYCGCGCKKPNDPVGCNDCSPWLNKLFKSDAAGIKYCDSITDMTKNSQGKRSVYCQAYDDDAGTRSSGNGIIKVTICNYGFEYAKDKSNTC